MAVTKEENNIFFIALLITVTVIPLVATQNIDCNGKAFHCVNSTHFKICVDLGGGISTTVDDFVIPCPKNTVCKSNNYFECEYIATTTYKPAQKSEVTNDISVTPLLKNIALATNSYNNTSDNEFSGTVVSTIPTSTLQFVDLTSNSALQNVGSDLSDSDRLRETTILEATTANEELISTTFTKVTLDNIESNDTIKNSNDFKINNITAKEIINALPNSVFFKSINENSKIGNIRNSSNIFIESSSNYSAINDKDHGIENNEQLRVTKFQIAIFDVISSTNSTDYTTEIAQSNTKYILNETSSENNNTLVSYNKTTNSNISFKSKLTETEISVVPDQTSSLTNSTADKSSYVISGKKEIPVRNVNNAELAINNGTLIDPTIELRFSSITDNVSTSELQSNNGPPKVLSERGKAVKYTATDKNIFYDIATITTEVENLIRDKIDTSASVNNSNIKNSTSSSIYQAIEVSNITYKTVDILQNSEISTLNVINKFDKILSPDEHFITTEAYNVTSNTFITPTINFESQINQESKNNSSLLLEHLIINLNFNESNKTTNSNISFTNNLTETEISVAPDQTSSLTNSTADESSYVIHSKNKISVPNINNAELAKNNQIIIDPTTELSFSSVTDNVSTSELHSNNGPSKILNERGRAIKYTVTDKNILFDIATATTEVQNLLREKIDTSASMNNSNIKNTSSPSIYKTTEEPNMNNTTVDILQNSEKSTLNVINRFDNILSPDEHFITTEAYNVTSKTFITPIINFESQIKQASKNNGSLLLEHSNLNLNSTESNNNFSLPIVESLKIKGNRINKLIPDTSYTMEQPPTLKEFASQSNVLKEISNVNIKIIGIETTESIPKTTYIYTSLEDRNLYPNPTLYEKDLVDSTIQLKSDGTLKFETTIHDGPYTSPMDNTNENTEPTNVKNEFPLEVPVRDAIPKVDIATTNNYYEQVTSVPTNSFINAEKNIKSVKSDMSLNEHEVFSKKLNTTQSSLHYFSNRDSVTHENIKIKETSTIDPLEISDVTFVSLSTFDIELRKNITNAEMKVQTANYNVISQAHNMNDIIISDAIIVKTNNLKTNSSDEKIIENKNEPVSTSLIQPHVNITTHNDVNVQKLDASIKKVDENINNNHTDMSIAAHNYKEKLPDINVTRGFGVKLYNVKVKGIKQNDDVQKLATANVVEVMNDTGTTQLIGDKKLDGKQVETENIEKRDQLISSTTEMGKLKDINVTETNYKTVKNTNVTIVNFVSNQTSIGINEENNIQIAKYFNDTKQMYINSNDNENYIQIITTDENYTTRFDIDTTVSIFSDLDITTEIYNSTKYKNLHNIINNTKINDDYKIKMFTLNNSDIIDPGVAAEIVLPTEIINKPSYKQIQSNNNTLNNDTRNLKIDPNSEANKQTYYNTRLSENSTGPNKSMLADLNINENIFKETREALPLDNLDNTSATLIIIPGHNNTISKKMVLLNNNLDTKLRITKDNKEIMQTSYNIENRAMNSNNNINVINGSSYFNNQIYNYSTFTDDTTATDSTIIVSPDIKMPKSMNGEIKEMKFKQIDDTLKRDINMNEKDNKTTKEMESVYNKTVDNNQSLETSGIRNEYNKTIINTIKFATNITVLNNTDNIANILSRNSSVYLIDNAIKLQESYKNNDMTKTKVILTLPEFGVADIADEAIRNESMHIENIISFNYSNMNLKTYNNGNKEKNKDINYKNVSADQMLHVNEKITADNLFTTTKLLESTITKNIPTIPPFSSQVNPQSIIEKNVNETNDYNNNPDSNISAHKLILTANSENFKKAVNNSVTPKNVLNIIFSATQQPKLNISSNYVHMTKNPLTYNLGTKQNLSAENIKTNQKTPNGNPGIQTISVIHRPTLNVNNFNYSNMNFKKYNNGVTEENKDINYKNVSADQMLQHVNEKIRADNLSKTMKSLEATITKNIPALPPFVTQANLQNVNETNVNENYNYNRDSNISYSISSRNINLTANLESFNKAVTNNSVTPKNVLNILFPATQQPKINVTTNYEHMTKSLLEYNLEPQQNSSATRQSVSHLSPAESKTISTTTDVVRDYLLFAETTTSLKKDKAYIPETFTYDFTTLPYEGNNKVTRSMKDIINIEENQKATGSITTLESVTTHNIRQIAATEPTDTLTPIACNMKSHGKYPDKNDCNKFFICIGKESPIIGKCPIGTVFSDIKKQCTTKLSHCVRNNQFKCLAEGRFIDVLSNNYYYICAKHKNGFVRFKLKCQDGYYLNSNNVSCLIKENSFEDDSKNTSESRTTSSSSERFQLKKSFNCMEEGQFEFPENCRKYYVCTKKASEFRRRVKQCESDEVFDRDKKKCVDEESYECRL